jgi:hypothetical protein
MLATFALEPMEPERLQLGNNDLLDMAPSGPVDGVNGLTL